MAKKQTKRKPGMHKLASISEEMKAWCAGLASELDTWPKVTSKPMFGMMAYYVGPQIFAVLPKTKVFFADRAIGIRTERLKSTELERLAKDPRSISNPIGKKWVSYQLEGPRDLNAALEWLSIAYEASRKTPKASDKKSFRKSKS